jgi:hypothetical protein
VGVADAYAIATALAGHTQLAFLWLGGNAFGSAGVLRGAPCAAERHTGLSLGIMVWRGAVCAIAAKLTLLPELGHLDLGAEVAGAMGGVGVPPMARDAEALLRLAVGCGAIGARRAAVVLGVK